MSGFQYFHQNMSGALNRGFQGHILYTFRIPEKVKTVRITFRFNKREWVGDTELLRKRCGEALLQNVPQQYVTDDAVTTAMGYVKGEINLSVRYNGREIGGMHRNLLLKEAVIGSDRASEGFLPTRFCGGIFQVDLHCLHIVNDNTEYELKVCDAESDTEESGAEKSSAVRSSADGSGAAL